MINDVSFLHSKLYIFLKLSKDDIEFIFYFL